jgi:hypothetical protein
MNNDYLRVPEDFPQAGVISAVGGAQNKLELVEYAGGYYSLGNTPPERHQQWLVCEDLVQQFVVKCRESKAGKRSHMTEEQLLSGYYDSATRAGWNIGSEQLKYVFRCTATVLGWPLPELRDRPWLPFPVEVDDAAMEEFNRLMSTPGEMTELQKMLKPLMK